MNRNISIRIKAALLLIIFALNNVIGFACAMGADMGFNTSHHHDEATEAKVHIHADGTKHHHHHEANKPHHGSKEDKDGCCNDKVIKIQSLDKNVNQNANITIHPPVFLFLNNKITSLIVTVIPNLPPQYIIRFFHPPPQDIRIQIKSFQI